MKRGVLLGGLETAACIALAMMMLLTAADVVGRHVLGRPVPGTIELVQYAMAVVVFAGLPVVTRDGRNISLSLLEGRLGPGAQRVQRAMLGAFCAIVLAVQGWIVFDTAQLMREQGDVIGFLNLPVHPAAYLMAALSAVTAVISLLHALTADKPAPAPAH